jgi:CTP synthase
VGLSPDIIVGRSKSPLEPGVRGKISNFCHVASSRVFGVHDVDNIYQVPVLLAEQGVHDALRCVCACMYVGVHVCMYV